MWGPMPATTLFVAVRLAWLSTSSSRFAITLHLQLIYALLLSPRPSLIAVESSPYNNDVNTGAKRPRAYHDPYSSPRALKRQAVTLGPAPASKISHPRYAPNFAKLFLERTRKRRQAARALRDEPTMIPPSMIKMEMRKLEAALGLSQEPLQQDSEGEDSVGVKKESSNEPEEESKIDDEIRARKAAHLEMRRSLLSEKTRREEAEAAERKRMRALKARKKKKLAKLRREARREAEEREFMKEKEEFWKVESLGTELSHFTIDEKGRWDDLDKYGRLLPPVKKVEKKRFVVLSSAWEAKVSAALAHRGEEKVLAKTLEGVDLTRKDIGTVVDAYRPSRMPWLNDEIVNGFYANLCVRANEQAGYVKGPNNTPRFAAYSSAWLTTVKQKGVTSIQGWSRRKGVKGEKLLKCERLFMPCNNGAHWTLLVISGTKKSVEYLDSMDRRGWTNKRMISLALDWLKMELGKKFNESEWQILESKTSIQDNTDDCGVFTCFNGWALAKGFDPSLEFGPGDMALARRLLVAVLLNGGFTGDFDL